MKDGKRASSFFCFEVLASFFHLNKTSLSPSFSGRSALAYPLSLSRDLSCCLSGLSGMKSFVVSVPSLCTNMISLLDGRDFTNTTGAWHVVCSRCGLDCCTSSGNGGSSTIVLYSMGFRLGWGFVNNWEGV